MGSSWDHLGLVCAHLVAVLAPSRDRLGRCKSRLGAVLGCLGPFWDRLGPCCAPLGLSWAALGPFWDRRGAALGCLGAVLGPSWDRAQAHRARVTDDLNQATSAGHTGLKVLPFDFDFASIWPRQESRSANNFLCIPIFYIWSRSISVHTINMLCMFQYFGIFIFYVFGCHRISYK